MTDLRYLLVPPTGLSRSERAPLIVFLHGSGERGDDLAKVKLWSPFPWLESGHKLPAFVVAPQCPLKDHWEDRFNELDGFLDSLLSQYPIDENRVLLTGFSMGGFGTWLWAQHRPERFAAIMPVGGNGFDVRDYRVGHDLGGLDETPVWMIHGAQDEVIPVAGADEMYQTLVAAGAPFGYTRYPHAGHTKTATLAYADRAHYDWLLDQKRQGSQ